MEIKYNKYVVYSVIVVLVALVAFNFEKITGYAGKVDQPAQITITNLRPGDILSDRQVARLKIDNSFPNQRLRVYRDRLNKFAGYTFNTENCAPVGTSSEYTCEAELYVTANELADGELYYFQAMDRKGVLEGNKAYFTFTA